MSTVTHVFKQTLPHMPHISFKGQVSTETIGLVPGIKTVPWATFPVVFHLSFYAMFLVQFLHIYLPPYSFFHQERLCPAVFMRSLLWYCYLYRNHFSTSPDLTHVLSGPHLWPRSGFVCSSSPLLGYFSPQDPPNIHTCLFLLTSNFCSIW